MVYIILDKIYTTLYLQWDQLSSVQSHSTKALKVHVVVHR